jgi:hypothetical protein
MHDEINPLTGKPFIFNPTTPRGTMTHEATKQEPGAELEPHHPLGQAIIEYAETFEHQQDVVARARAWVRVTRVYKATIDQQIADLTRERDAAREEAARLRGALTRAAIDAHAPHIPYKAIYRSVGTTLEECPLSICKRNYAALREQPTDTAEGD